MPGEAHPASHIMASHFSGLALNDIPEPVRREARRAILDTAACAVAGARGPLGPAVKQAARALGTDGRASAAGSAHSTSTAAAAYANARIANVMDFDETFPVGAHFGVGAFAAALAVAEAHDAGPEDFTAAFIAGYEAGARVAAAIGPMLARRPSGELGYPDIWGAGAPVTLASAAAAARARRLSPEVTAQAYVLAASFTPIPTGQRWSSAIDLPNCKYTDAGWCAHAGVFAANLAAAGGEGYPDIFDGEPGFFAMAGAPAADPSRLTAALGERWFLPEITYKMWPSCRWTHYPLTALDRLLAAGEVDIGRVEHVEVLTSPLAFSERFTKTVPRGYVERQYSLPHLVAAMLLRIAPERWLDDDIANDPDLARLRKRVSCSLHPDSGTLTDGIDDGLLKRIPGGVRVVAGGRQVEAHSNLALGDPWSSETFATNASLADKFGRIAGKAGAGLGEAVLADTDAPLDPASVGTWLRTGSEH